MNKKDFSVCVVEEINKFRNDPKSIIKKLETFQKGLSRLRKKDPFLKDVDIFIEEIHKLKKMHPLAINEQLSEVAKKEVEKFSKDEDSYESLKIGEELKGIVPFYYLKENPCLIADSGADEPSDVLTKILLNKLDERKIGRNAFTNDEYTQIGIAHTNIKGENYVIIITCLNFVKKRSNVPLPEGYDLTQLKKIFDQFDTGKHGEFNPIEVAERLKKLKMDKENPQLYELIKGLDKHEIVDFPIFANEIIKAINNKDSLSGLRIIFNLYVDDHKNDLVTIDHMIDIVDELKDKKAKNKLCHIRNYSRDVTLNFNKFKNYMFKNFNEIQINNKINQVKKLQFQTYHSRVNSGVSSNYDTISTTSDPKQRNKYTHSKTGSWMSNDIIESLGLSGKKK
jgi:Ca2+-binding EF-hand superfamily protein